MQEELYKQTTSQSLKILNSTPDGLSINEASQRLRKYGPNVLSTKKRKWLKRLIEPFASVFVSILVLAAVISLIANKKLDAVVITIVLTINAVIYYVQQYSADKVLKALQKTDSLKVKVKRGGEIVEIISAELVPGDIVYINEGDKVAADGRLLEAENLRISEAILTGESLPIQKITEPLTDKKLEIYDQKNMVFRDTIVHSGSGVMVVGVTGNGTEIGKISSLAAEAQTGQSPIERKIDDFVKKLAIAFGVVGLLVFGLALVRGIELGEALRFSLALIVSVVPEGLPVALTITLLLSAKKLAKVKALVKKTSALETLGAVTLIATDKTGTLTKNRLVVTEYHSLSKNDSEFRQATLACVNGAKNLHSDPLDEILAEKFGDTKTDGWHKVKEYPFNQEMRASGVLWQVNERLVLYIKGAPEALAEHTSTNVEKEVMDYVKKGYRTIAVGHKILNKQPEKLSAEVLKNLEIDGFLGLSDELRDDIAKSIAEAKNAGIKVVMLTGDHVETARNIALNINLAQNAGQVASSSLLEVENPTLETVGVDITAFGRVLPKHKFNFLRAVKGREITAMTGDGVNDIPALLEADAGLAMGSGTDAAKDASDIVLLDDNFKTIISAIRIGRSVLANIKKMLFYVLSTSIGEVFTMVGALMLGWPLPVTAVQILWINLVTDGFTILPLGLSEPEKHQMERRPDNAKSALLNRTYISRMLITGLTMAIVTLILFNGALKHGYEYAQTVAFLALVVGQWANSLTANYYSHSWTKIFTKPNKLLLGGIVLSILFQVIAMYGPLAGPLGTVGLSTNDILIACLLPGILTLLAGDLHKLVVRQRSKTG